MGIYDQAARWAAQNEPNALAQRLLRDTGLSLRFRGWVGSQTTPTPGETERTADQVAAFDDDTRPEQPWLLLVEFQSSHDPEKLDVTLQEAAALRVEVRHGEQRRGRYNVLTALVYLRGRCPNGVLDMTAGGFGTRHAPVVWNVEEGGAGAALQALAEGKATWGVLFWIVLMHGGADPGIIQRWRELASALAPERVRGELAHIALIFAELAGSFLAWEKGLEGWEVTESQYVNRLIERGELRRARADLLRVLNSRFPGAVPEEVVEAVNMQPSMSLLDSWLAQAATVESIEEFVAFLRR